MNRYFDDDDAQVEGDASGPVNFAPSSPGQPWLRPALPPWHLWGNTQRLTVPVETVGALRQGGTNQLVRLAYKRPETWHWLFSARLISGPANTAAFFTRIFVHWELTTGIGRSAIRMHFADGPVTTPISAFDTYTFQWGPVDPTFPVGAHIWTTQTLSPSRSFQGDGPYVLNTPCSEIVAEDLQLQAQVVALTVVDNVAAVGQPVTVELSASFAPKNHIRPDWFADGPPEVQYGGGEVQGK